MSSDLNKGRRTGLPGITLRARVKGQESAGNFWKESSVITAISRTGASFNLQRKCSIGQLISLMLPMPETLRCYDLEKEFYQVWGIVQYCTQNVNNTQPGYHTGIAFIGKYAPASYKENPLNSYRISGLNELGLWKVYEAPKAFILRKHQRFAITLDVCLEFFNPQTEERIEEKAVLENISQSGAAVLSSLDTMVGDQIKFICNEPDFASVAIVTNQEIRKDSDLSLNLEFVENEFPIKEIFINAVSM